MKITRRQLRKLIIESISDYKKAFSDLEGAKLPTSRVQQFNIGHKAGISPKFAGIKKLRRNMKKQWNKHADPEWQDLICVHFLNWYGNVGFDSINNYNARNNKDEISCFGIWNMSSLQNILPSGKDFACFIINKDKYVSLVSNMDAWTEMTQHGYSKQEYIDYYKASGFPKRPGAGDLYWDKGFTQPEEVFPLKPDKTVKYIEEVIVDNWSVDQVIISSSLQVNDTLGYDAILKWCHDNDIQLITK